jgi:succinoglycan biosynthesis protein ExoM
MADVTNLIGVTVCICTFRRPSVRLALESVTKQELPAEAALRILIIDNDLTPTARNLVEGVSALPEVQLEYRHVPGQNISLARNAALDAAKTDWLAFIDDDEYAPPVWLQQLLAARAGADAVFGPSEAIYPSDTPDWVKAGDYHSNWFLERRTPLYTGHTSNVLINMRLVRQHNLRFDLSLGQTGGEDTIFFHAMYKKGGVLRYAPNAVVFENVAPSRLSLKWIARRRFRVGQVYAMMFQRFDGFRYPAFVLAAPTKIAFCVMMFAIMALLPARAMWWLMRAVFHLGSVSYALGANVYQEYRPGAP